MCIIVPFVKEVDKTNIFARFVDDEAKRQLLVYGMHVDAPADTAMILPLPVDTKQNGEKAVQFIDMSKYPDFFEDMNKGFPQVRGRGFSKGIFDSFGLDDIEVHDVGAFIASYVPTIRDFSRLDKRFRMPIEMPIYSDYGFAVFQLKPGEQTVHPMAFTFPSRSSDKLYYPTVHIHDGKLHEEEDFDHNLYAQGTGGAKDEVPKQPSLEMANISLERASEFLDKNKSPVGLFDGKRFVYRVKLKGRRPNRDTFLKTESLTA